MEQADMKTTTDIYTIYEIIKDPNQTEVHDFTTIMTAHLHSRTCGGD
jgi:hypothetical protein